MTDYFFTIIELGNPSFGNEPSFTQQKEKFPLIKCLDPIYIDFDEYPRYSGRNSEIFGNYVNENIKCEHGYAYPSGKHNMCKWVNEEAWEIIKNCFPGANQIKKCPKMFHAKNVHMFKKIKMETMRKLIPQQILKKLSFCHSLLKNLIIRCKVLN